MSGDFRDHINPLLAITGVQPLNPHPQPRPAQAQPPHGISGHIVAIHRGARHAHEGTVLDLSVGGGDYTDIVVRVPTGDYGHIEGKHVVVYLIEQ